MTTSQASKLHDTQHENSTIMHKRCQLSPCFIYHILVFSSTGIYTLETTNIFPYMLFFSFMISFHIPFSD